MPNDLSIPQNDHAVNPPLTDQDRAGKRDRLRLLRYRLLLPYADPAAYWRDHDEAEALSTLLAGPVREIAPRCEPATPPVYATREVRATLKRAITRPSKDAV